MNGQGSRGPVPEPVLALILLGGTVAKRWTASKWNKVFSLIAKVEFAIIASNGKLVLDVQFRSEKEVIFSINPLS